MKRVNLFSSLLIALFATLAAVLFTPQSVLAVLSTIRPYFKITSAVAGPSSMASTKAQFEGIPVVPPQDPSLNAAANRTVIRKVKMHFEAIETPEGDGAMVRRSIGTPKLKNL